jgi:SOS-response transcriptional repressor LexA
MFDEYYSSCSGAEPFALQVVGDSMEPEFKDGAIIVVDPDAVAEHGSYVIAAQGDDYIFRQLVVERGEMSLRALNDAYPSMPLPGGVNGIKGVVVQQAGRRRRDRKHYL